MSDPHGLGWIVTAVVLGETQGPSTSLGMTELGWVRANARVKGGPELRPHKTGRTRMSDQTDLSE
jgi:hypothetical protein